MKDFLVITAFMDTGDRFRRRNLIESVNRTKEMFPEADIVVSEQGDGKWFGSTGLDCMHLCSGNVGDFCKTKLLNAAVRANPGRVAYLMVDADVLLSAPVVEYIKNHYMDGSLVYPYGDCMYLNEPDTARAIAHRELLPGAKDHGIAIARQTGLCNVFTWDTYCKVGGYDESFVGWGAEDDAYLVKCRRLVAPIVRNTDKNAMVHHMFHMKVNTPEYMDKGPLYVNNRVRCACIRRMSDEDLANYVSGNSTMDEMISKYNRLGRLDIRIDWKYTPRYTLHMDATIYDIDRNGEMTMTKVLDAMFAEDGAESTIAFIDDVKEKVVDLNDEQIAELDAARNRYAASIRA